MITLTLSPRTQEARALAWRLLVEHGLVGWSFRFNRSKTMMGTCRFGPRIIELSRHFAERNELAAIQDTLLHEVAHALAGRTAGHGPAWQTICRGIGARPERLSDEAEMPPGRWQAVCAGCGTIHHKYRKPKHMRGWHCRRCGPDLGRLNWELAFSRSHEPSGA